jgi:hypothetical protein
MGEVIAIYASRVRASWLIRDTWTGLGCPVLEGALPHPLLKAMRDAERGVLQAEEALVRRRVSATRVGNTVPTSRGRPLAADRRADLSVVPK